MKSNRKVCAFLALCATLLLCYHIVAIMGGHWDQNTYSLHELKTMISNLLYTGNKSRDLNTHSESDPESYAQLYIDRLKMSRDCIEDNICKDPKLNSDIYYYKRTNFDILVDTPVNLSAIVNHTHDVVPRKVHFCLFSNGNLTFRFVYMLAIMSASRFVKPDMIYFWHDNLPVGDYWEETRQRVKNIYLVHRDRPTSIRGNNVRVIQHVADIVRLEALLEYGGMYFDTDSIVVNPIDPILRYDVTMGHALPTTLANGIMFSKRWPDFFKIWHKEYATFDDNIWARHSVRKPFQLSKKYPNLIHVEAASLCRPNFHELDHLYGNKSWNWQHDNYVVHLYIRLGPKIEWTPENVKCWNTTVGSIMRYIYYSNSTLMPCDM